MRMGHGRYAPVVRRERATTIIDDLLATICARKAGSVLDIVVGVDVFGSYARGAQDPGDVDLNIEFDHERMLGRFDAYEYIRGRHQTAIRKALVGGSRTVNLVFQARRFPDMYRFELTPLWHEGDDLATARARLQRIADDPTAGRASRDHMLPAFDGMERWLPIYLRERICRGVEIGAVTVEAVGIAERRITDFTIAATLDRRWKPGGAPNRVGHALLAYYRDRGIDPGTVHLQGQDVRDSDTPYFAGFGCQCLRHVPDWFTRWGGREHVEVPRGATKTADLRGLRIIAADSAQFDEHDVLMWDVFG
jgi:hypothetical protein